MCAPRHPNHGGRRRSSPSKIPSLDARRRAQISKSRRLTFARRDLEPTSAHSQLDTRVISGQHACNLRATRAHSQLDTRALSKRRARTLKATGAHSQSDGRSDGSSVGGGIKRFCANSPVSMVGKYSVSDTSTRVLGSWRLSTNWFAHPKT